MNILRAFSSVLLGGVLLCILLVSHTYRARNHVITQSDWNNVFTNKSETEGNMWRNDSKLPGVLVVGIKKCGTGAIIEILKMHPEIAAPCYTCTDVEFFNNDELYRLGTDYYKVKLAHSLQGGF